MPPVMYQQVSNETDSQQNPYLGMVSSFEYLETKREVSLLRLNRAPRQVTRVLGLELEDRAKLW